MYIKLSGMLAEINQKKEYIYGLYGQVCLKVGYNTKAVLEATGIKNLFVMAVYY